MGVEKEIISAGKGPKPTLGQIVTLHCTGYGKNNDPTAVFYSTREQMRKPVTFIIGRGHVIKGWDKGVLQMQVGEVARLKCSPEYAFGANGFLEWGIQPNSHLVFEMQLLDAE